MRDRERLFCKLDLANGLDGQLAKARTKIDEFKPERVLGTPLEDLVAFVVQECDVVPIRLHEDAIDADVQEIDVDVSGDPGRYITHDGPHLVKGTRLRWHVPFEG